MKRFLYLSVTVILLVVFISGCSARGEAPESTTIANTETLTESKKEETTTVKASEKATEELTEKATEEATEETDKETTSENFTLTGEKISREPLSYDSIDPSKPMIAITFDDGPSAHTARLLNILKENGAKATFFVVGSQIKGKEPLLKRMVTEGHEVAGHSWSHANLTKLNEEALAKQLAKTRSAIKKATGVDALLARPPYGSCNNMVKSVASQEGVALIMWSVDTRDWESRNATAVYNKTLNSVKNGDIILCHDLHGTTVDAMERVIPALIEKGYQLVTVSELLTYERDELTAGEIYRRR